LKRITVIPSITPYPETSQLSNVRVPERGRSLAESRFARGDQTLRIRIAWSVSTFRGTSRRARERRRLDSAKRAETRVSRFAEAGRWRDAIRDVALSRRGEWIRKWLSRVVKVGTPIHFPYSLRKLRISIYRQGWGVHVEKFLGLGFCYYSL
jgi:hypothetical protein